MGCQLTDKEREAVNRYGCFTCYDCVAPYREKMSKFSLCVPCNRYSWQEDNVCLECGVKLCGECGVELRPPETHTCSVCVSASEHAVEWEMA